MFVLSIPGRAHDYCDRVSRRELLQVGALGFGGLTLAGLLRHEARASTAPRRPKSVIYVVLDGGISHIDTWDLKPDAPAEYRGAFKPISTKLTGVQICELMPRQAAMMDRLALLRGVWSVENDHFLSEVYTGLPRTAGKRPAFGSVVSRLGKNSPPLPAYVSLQKATVDQFEFEKAYYAGPGHAPFRPFDESLGDLAPVKSFDQLQDRKQLLGAFDSMRRNLDSSGTIDALDRFQAQAMEMITSPRAREAFDLSREPIKLLDAYGHKAGKFTHQADKDILYDWDARPFLLARRLVEAGVRVVTLRVGGWGHQSGPKQDSFRPYRAVLPVVGQ